MSSAIPSRLLCDGAFNATRGMSAKGVATMQAKATLHCYSLKRALGHLANSH